MKPTKREADRSRDQQPALAKQYRAIGPAALVAALLHTSKKQKPATPRSAVIKAA